MENDQVSRGRRRFIGLMAWGAATCLLPGLAEASRSTPPRARKLSFYNLHTDERLDACYWERGSYVPSALEEIDAVLRDHRTGEIRPMSPRLLDLVFALTVQLGSVNPVRIISGYRSAATNEMLRAESPGRVAERSLHLTGEAVDLCFANQPLHRVRDAAIALRGGGVGYYPKSGFVHVDIGRIRTW